jgi:hypothetical protein
VKWNKVSDHKPPVLREILIAKPRVSGPFKYFVTAIHEDLYELEGEYYYCDPSSGAYFRLLDECYWAEIEEPTNELE